MHPLGLFLNPDPEVFHKVFHRAVENLDPLKVML
jgi:hypothetical protein